MLFINKRYESLDKILNLADKNEELTEAGFTKLKDLIIGDKDKAEILNDDDIELYKNAIIDAGLKNSLAKYDDYFDVHELALYKSDIIRIFLYNKEYNALEMILKSPDNGIISVNDIKNKSNIYELCKGFENSAKEIASLDKSAGGKSVGRFEVLLRFILKNGKTPEIGDVGVGNKVIEVKACSNKDGAHPSFQGQANKEGSTLFSKLDDVFNTASKGNIDYTQKKYIDTFNSYLKKTSKEDVKNALISGIRDGYAGYSTANPSPIIDEYESYFNSCNFDNITLRNMIGRSQLLMYASAVSDYLIIINSVTGNYLFMSKDDIIEKSKLVFYKALPLNEKGRYGVEFLYKN